MRGHSQETTDDSTLKTGFLKGCKYCKYPKKVQTYGTPKDSEPQVGGESRVSIPNNADTQETSHRSGEKSVLQKGVRNVSILKRGHLSDSEGLQT